MMFAISSLPISPRTYKQKQKKRVGWKHIETINLCILKQRILPHSIQLRSFFHEIQEEWIIQPWVRFEFRCGEEIQLLLCRILLILLCMYVCVWPKGKMKWFFVQNFDRFSNKLVIYLIFQALSLLFFVRLFALHLKHNLRLAHCYSRFSCNLSQLQHIN